MAAPMTLPATGRCRCGAIQFQVTAPPLFTFVCHCTGCQKMTGGYATVAASFQGAHVDLLEGELIRGGAMTPGIEHMHCPKCLSAVYTKGDKLNGRINVRVSAFDDAAWFVPAADLWMSEALPGDSAASGRAYDGWPEPEDVPQIAAEFAEKLQVAAQ